MASKGGQIGNDNASRGAVARRALLKAIERKSTGDTGPLVDRMSVLVQIWEKQIDIALEGNQQSATMIVERLDGKPKQAIVGGDDDDNPLTVITRIELVPFRDGNSN